MAGSVVFVGDVMDAGAQASTTFDGRRAPENVRDLVGCVDTLAFMGRQELCAVIFQQSGPKKQPHGPYSEKSRHQHRSFVEAFGIDALAWTDWSVAAMPLSQVGNEFRLMRGCWEEPGTAVIGARSSSGHLQPEYLLQMAREETDFFAARSPFPVAFPCRAEAASHVIMFDRRGDERAAFGAKLRVRCQGVGIGLIGCGSTQRTPQTRGYEV